MYLSKRRQNKDLFKYKKAERISHQKTWTPRKVKRNPSVLQQDENLDLHKGTQSTGNSKHVSWYNDFFSYLNLFKDSQQSKAKMTNILWIYNM